MSKYILKFRMEEIKMRRRIVSLLCVVAVLAAMLSVCIVTTLADDAVKLAEPITGTLNAADWDPAESVNSVGSFFADANDSKKTITAVQKYNLGTNWEASVTVAHISNSNCSAQPFVLKVGDLEAVLYNCKYNKTTSTVTQNAYIALKVNDIEVATYDLGDKAGTFDGATPIRGALGLKYKNGNAKVLYKGDTVLTYDIPGLDFSNTEISLSVTGNWVPNAMGISEFNLSADYSTSSVPVSVDVSGDLDAADWTGNTECIGTIQGTVRFYTTADTSVKTITSVNSYTLFDKWESTITINDTWNDNAS